LIIASR